MGFVQVSHCQGRYDERRIIWRTPQSHIYSSGIGNPAKHSLFVSASFLIYVINEKAISNILDIGCPP